MSKKQSNPRPEEVGAIINPTPTPPPPKRVQWVLIDLDSKELLATFGESFILDFEEVLRRWVDIKGESKIKNPKGIIFFNCP